MRASRLAGARALLLSSDDAAIDCARRRQQLRAPVFSHARKKERKIRFQHRKPSIAAVGGAPASLTVYVLKCHPQNVPTAPLQKQHALIV